MDKITNIDYRVLCYMKKLNSCFIDEIASKFGQAGLASIDNLDDLGYICMPYVSGLTDVIEGESGKTSSQMVSNCMMLTPQSFIRSPLNVNFTYKYLASLSCKCYTFKKQRRLLSWIKSQILTIVYYAT